VAAVGVVSNAAQAAIRMHGVKKEPLSGAFFAGII